MCFSTLTVLTLCLHLACTALVGSDFSGLGSSNSGSTGSRHSSASPVPDTESSSDIIIYAGSTINFWDLDSTSPSTTGGALELAFGHVSEEQTPSTVGYSPGNATNHHVVPETTLSESGCGPSQIYSEQLRECISVECSPTRVFHGDRCLKLPRQSNTSEGYYEVKLRLRPLSAIPMHSAYRITNKVLRQLGQAVDVTTDTKTLSFCSVVVLLKTGVGVHDVVSIESLGKDVLEAYYVKVKAVVTGGHDPEMLMDLVTVPGEIHAVDTAFEVTIIDGYNVDFDVASNLSEYKTTEEYILGHMSSVAFASHSGSTFMVPFLQPVDTCERKKRFIPLSSIKPCPLVRLSKQDVEWKEVKSGLTFTAINWTLEFEEFHFATDSYDTILLCFHKYEYLYKHLHFVASDGFQTTEVLLPIACIGLSLICLLVTLFTFGCVRAFWTLPGKNILALVGFLIIAQSLYLTGNLIGFEIASLSCVLIGILTHFFWLLVLFWLQISTFHAYTMYSKTSPLYKQNDSTLYFLYHLYCFSLSASCVLVNIAVSFYLSEPSGVGYGALDCYISSDEMLAYTFGLPLAFVVISNLIMFSVATHSSYRIARANLKNERAIKTNNLYKPKPKTSEPSKKELSKSSTMTSRTSKIDRSRNQMAIFAGLSAITGITWACGFLEMWTKLSAFAYIFIVLNAVQGVYVMVAFVCDSRVLNVLRRQRKTVTSPSQTMTSKV